MKSNNNNKNDSSRAFSYLILSVGDFSVIPLQRIPNQRCQKLISNSVAPLVGIYFTYLLAKGRWHFLTWRNQAIFLNENFDSQREHDLNSGNECRYDSNSMLGWVEGIVFQEHDHSPLYEIYDKMVGFHLRYSISRNSFVQVTTLCHQLKVLPNTLLENQKCKVNSERSHHHGRC